MATKKENHNFQSFSDFYPFYLSEHSNMTCRRLHVIGTFLVFIQLFRLIMGNFNGLFYGLLCGYGFAWTGHFFFEKNRPATFTYPVWSLMGDFRMFYDCVTGKIPL